MNAADIARFLSRTKRREGRCYELAGKVMLSPYGDDLILVHGRALNRLGVSLPHAWLELPTGETFCPVSDVPVRGPVAEWRGSKDQFARTMLEHGHWGPWP
jgi:hypothetical protein